LHKLKLRAKRNCLSGILSLDFRAGSTGPFLLCYCVGDWSADSNEPLSGRALDPQESEAVGQPGKSAAVAAPLIEPRPLPRLGRHFWMINTRVFSVDDPSPRPVGSWWLCWRSFFTGAGWDVAGGS